MVSLSTTRSLAALFIFSFAVQNLAAGIFVVKAKVDGKAGEQIGKINVSTSGPVLTSRFTVADDFGFLDDWYDFRWVQIVTATNVSSVDAPFVDPQPGQDIGSGRKGDKLPFYTNQTEWDAGEVSGKKIREDGEWSQFTDRPSGDAGAMASFNSFLVAQDITSGTFQGKKFSVLAGFSWDWKQTSGGASFTNLAGITISDAVIKSINETMDENDDFKSWTALNSQNLTGCTVVPEPTSIAMWGLAGALGLVIARRRKRMMAA